MNRSDTTRIVDGEQALLVETGMREGARLLELLGYTPSAKDEANYDKQLSNQAGPL